MTLKKDIVKKIVKEYMDNKKMHKKHNVRFKLNYVRVIRARLGYTQIRLADILGISQPTISLWESGRFMPTMYHAKELFKLAKKAKIKVNVEDFRKY